MEWITQNMDTIGAVVAFVVALVPVIFKCRAVWKDSKDWKKIGRIALDFIDHHLANEDPDVAHAKAKELRAVQDLHGVGERTDAELDALRTERARKAKPGGSGLELGLDIDPNTKRWIKGANVRWRKSF